MLIQFSVENFLSIKGYFVIEKVYNIPPGIAGLVTLMF